MLFFQNLDRRRQKQKYDLYEDDEFMEIESQLDKKVLSKYDEEIDGEKKSSFQLGKCINTKNTDFHQVENTLSPLLSFLLFPPLLLTHSPRKVKKHYIN